MKTEEFVPTPGKITTARQIADSRSKKRLYPEKAWIYPDGSFPTIIGCVSVSSDEEFVVLETRIVFDCIWHKIMFFGQDKFFWVSV